MSWMPGFQIEKFAWRPKASHQRNENFYNLISNSHISPVDLKIFMTIVGYTKEKRSGIIRTSLLTCEEHQVISRQTVIIPGHVGFSPHYLIHPFWRSIPP